MQGATVSGEQVAKLILACNLQVRAQHASLRICEGLQTQIHQILFTCVDRLQIFLGKYVWCNDVKYLAVLLPIFQTLRCRYVHAIQGRAYLVNQTSIGID